MAKLWIEGIPAPNTFNWAVSTLVRDLRRRRARPEVAAAELHNWLDSHHNCQSNTYNASPAAAHAEVDEIVERFYGRSVVRNWDPLPGVSEFELSLIINATSTDEGIADRETGELLSRYKVQRLCFEVVNHAKQWVLTEARERATRLASGRGGEPGSEPWTNAMLFALRDLWPDPNRPGFVVPIPLNLRTSFKGLGKKSQGPLWKVIQTAGICRLERKGSHWTGRAATFRVTLDFGAASPGGAVFHDLDTGLARALTCSQVRKLYSRYYASSILKSATLPTHTIAPPERDPIWNLVQGRLRRCFDPLPFGLEAA